MSRAAAPTIGHARSVSSSENTTCDSSGEDRVEPTVAWLVPLDGPHRVPFELRAGDTLSVGRSRSSSVQVDDSAVSRLHATISWTGGRSVVVADHHSRNGTEVDGVRIGDRREVAQGGVIRVGPRRLLVLLPDASASAVSRGSSSMARAQELARRAAVTVLPVLLIGETGVGKEVLARRVHDDGPRATGPFVAQNCAAISESLAESLLFGHEKGSFTGAAARAAGVFEAASGGTLFLDEIGELGLPMQARLLRVIEQREVVRVGATRPTPIDTRLVAATHRDLDAMVLSGSFRADLLYRLDVIRITIPPLRERPDEIDALTRRFLAELDPSGRVSLDTTARAALERHGWPGNVRELRNVLSRAIALGSGPVLHVEDLGLPPRDEVAAGPLRGAVDDTERSTIVAALDATRGNRTRAARRLGISRRTLLYKLERLGIQFPPADR